MHRIALAILMTFWSLFYITATAPHGFCHDPPISGESSVSAESSISAERPNGASNVVLKRTYESVRGTPVSLPSAITRATTKATVLVFVSSTCPIANGYAPEINRMIQKYTPQGVEFLLVHVEKDLSLPAAKQHVKEFGYRCNALLDRQRNLVKQVDATITPEAALISPSGEVLYRGRIDDRFPSIGIQRSKARKTELRDAIDSFLAGKPIQTARTKAVGCFIE